VTAFEEMNRVAIVLTGRVEPVAGNKEVVFLIQAEDLEEDSPVPKVLASLKCRVGSGAHRTMESAIMWALYQLDWELSKDKERRTK